MRAPERARTSGIRKPSPISTSSPRDTTTSRPSASAASASSTAAALLLTTSARLRAGQPSQRVGDVLLPRPALAGRRGRARGSSSRAPTSTTRSSALDGSGARPRFVWTITPVALSTRRSDGARSRSSSARAAATGSPGSPPARIASRARSSALRAAAVASARGAAASTSSPSSRSTDGRSRSVHATKSTKRERRDDLAQERDEVARGPCADLEDALVVDRLGEDTCGRVRHAREREAADPHVPRGEHLRHGRHADEVGAERAQHADLGRRLEGRPEPRRVDALAEREPESPGRGVRQRPVAPGRRRRTCRGSAGRACRRSARRAATSPGGSGGRRSRRGCRGRRPASSAPQALVSTRLEIPSRPSTRTPKTTVGGRMALVEMRAALHHGHGHAAERCRARASRHDRRRSRRASPGSRRTGSRPRRRPRPRSRRARSRGRRRPRAGASVRAAIAVDRGVELRSRGALRTALADHGDDPRRRPRRDRRSRTGARGRPARRARSRASRPAPSRASRPSSRSRRARRGTSRSSPVWMSVSASNSSSIVPKPPGKITKPSAAFTNIVLRA